MEMIENKRNSKFILLLMVPVADFVQGRTENRDFRFFPSNETKIKHKIVYNFMSRKYPWFWYILMLRRFTILSLMDVFGKDRKQIV